MEAYQLYCNNQKGLSSATIVVIAIPNVLGYIGPDGSHKYDTYTYMHDRTAAAVV